MHHYLYKIVCTHPSYLNWEYIGIRSYAGDIASDSYMGSGTWLTATQKKYGMSFFKKIILETVSSREKLLFREAQLVDKVYLKLRNVFNIALGGNGGILGKEYTAVELCEKRYRVDCSSLSFSNFEAEYNEAILGTHLIVREKYKYTLPRPKLAGLLLEAMAELNFSEIEISKVVGLRSVNSWPEVDIYSCYTRTGKGNPILVQDSLLNGHLQSAFIDASWSFPNGDAPW